MLKQGGPEESTVVVRLLGGLQVAVSGAPVADGAWRLRRARTLIKLLALSPERRLHREQLVEALWPDGGSSPAGLHQVLYVARKALSTADAEAGGALAMRDDVVELAAEGLWVDVDAFELAAAAARRGADLDAYQAALDLYGGELLPEDRYESWAAARRESLRELHLALLIEQSELLRAAEEDQAAVEALLRAIAEDPMHEGAHRSLMRTFAATGRRQQALAQYQQLKQLLSEQLAAEPDPETSALYREILASQHGDRDGVPPAVGEPRAGTIPAEPPNGGEGGRARAAQAMPRQLTSFIGRDGEIAELQRLLARARLLTIAGPGGAGKTRLAYELAARREPDFADGIHILELAPIDDPALVVEQVATMLGMQLRSERDPLEALASQIGRRSMLLVLDNCEHLVGACATLVDGLLRACPAVRVLATSRERLRVDGEVAWRVPPLSLPEPAPGVRAAELEPFEAVRLFCERAADVSPGFRLDDENAASVAEICRGLDGMPLALELAAARASMLTPAQIAERISDALALLGHGSRVGLTRQQTLRATLQWSHDLLTEPERGLYRRLGVFAGSFGIEAVEHVAQVSPPLEAPAVDLLGALVDKSLVQVEAGRGANRYRLLETVRLDARERLVAAGELPAVEAAHRSWYVALAQAADRDLDPGVAAAWPVDAIEGEHDNFRAALASGIRDDPADALRLGCGLWWFWMIRGYFSEGVRWLTEAVAAAEAPTPERCRGLFGLGALCVRTQGDVARTVRFGREAVEIAAAQADPAVLARALERLGMMGMGGFDWETADEALAQGLELARELGDDPVVVAVRQSQGVLAGCRGETELARTLFTEGLDLLDGIPPERGPVFWATRISPAAIPAGPDGAFRFFFEDTFCLFRSVDSRTAAGYMHCNLAETWRAEGSYDLARESLNRGLEQFARLGDAPGEAGALNALGNLARLTGEFDVGRAHFERALELRRQSRDPREIATTITGMGMLALASGRHAEGLDLCEQARAIYERTEDAPGLEGIPLNVAAFELDAGELRRACNLLERVTALSMQRGGLQRIGSWASAELAEAAIGLGEETRARDALAFATSEFRRYRDTRGLSYARSLEARLSGTHAGLSGA